MKSVLELIKKTYGVGLDNNLDTTEIEEGIKKFYKASTLAERINAMIDVRCIYEGIQIRYNYNSVLVTEDVTKLVGEFHRISVTIISKELGDDAQYLDKIMSKAWDIYMDNRLSDKAKMTMIDIEVMLKSVMTDAGE